MLCAILLTISLVKRQNASPSAFNTAISPPRIVTPNINRAHVQLRHRVASVLFAASSGIPLSVHFCVCVMIYFESFNILIVLGSGLPCTSRLSTVYGY